MPRSLPRQGLRLRARTAPCAPPRAGLPSGHDPPTIGDRALDPLIRILVQAAQWLRHPPSRTHVRIMVAVVVLALALVAIETWVGWPDWGRVDQRGGLVVRP
ncbi:hypothetical protein [Roseomonas sp. CECT 9278]|uniref:hypothetical protein n=1 Tax=Roseomonas sp. CECT 9278 TaxID=2845823 RepID=UPI001E2AAFC6|nr:hypothetical protein [Roseomonas sp. CECT 9278]CAH0197878.1 hypothetical protein ROS9278_01849 [Roseomonas sp. CECT 9278]